MDAFERLTAIADRRHIDGLAALDHYDLEAELAGGRDFAVSRRSAAVLGDDHVDAALYKQAHLVGLGKRAGGKDSGDVGESERWRHRIDAAHDVAVLRRPFEMEGFLSTDGQEDAARPFAESRHGLRHAFDVRPAIARLRLPSRSAQGKERCSGRCRCGGRIQRDAGGEGMCRIDEQRNGFLLEKGSETLGTAEAADSGRQGLRSRVGRATGKRDRGIEAAIGREAFAELSRFGRSPKDQDARSAGG